jgi:hypothetical protein
MPSWMRRVFADPSDTIGHSEFAIRLGAGGLPGTLGRIVSEGDSLLRGGNRIDLRERLSFRQQPAARMPVCGLPNAFKMENVSRG